MLRIVEPDSALPPDQRFALDVIVDISRVARVDHAAIPAIALRVVSRLDRASATDVRAAGWGIIAVDGAVMIDRACLDLVGRLAGAAPEQRSSLRDRHGRVPPSENPAVQLGWERDPVVHRVARALREATIAAAAQTGQPTALVSPWPRGLRWAVALSHDLDVVSAWPLFTALRLVELARKRQFGIAARAAGAAVVALPRDPVTEAVAHILDVERRHAVTSTWFIITETPTLASTRAGDVTYSPESPRARAILRMVGEQGHELALHGSFATYASAEVFAAQRERLARLTDRTVGGVRQHFLRMRPGATQAAMLDAGFRYDSTYGFSDRNGFRLGVADVVPAWCDAERRTIPLDELPFLWMDRALSKYRGVETPDAWVDDALALAETCREVDGVWVGIWHPNLTPALGFPGAPQAFERLVRELASSSPWMASMSDIVRWRAARRGLRVAGLDASGSFRLARAASTTTQMHLEDANGRQLRSVDA